MASSNSFATNLAQGANCIPASQRPDGTWRKPRRVKDGYVPQEEVPLYESKGRQFAAKMSSNCPVGMPLEMVMEAKTKRENKEKNVRCPIPGLMLPATETKKKKAVGADELLSSMARTSLGSSNGGKKQNHSQTPIDPAKRLKNLRKKLREIEVLEEKLNKGEIENPEKDQLEKVKNKDKVVKEITELEVLVNN